MTGGTPIMDRFSGAGSHLQDDSQSHVVHYLIYVFAVYHGAEAVV